MDDERSFNSLKCGFSLIFKVVLDAEVLEVAARVRTAVRHHGIGSALFGRRTRVDK